ncbi:hypothetical protein D9M69_726800 [compost metagenome]
MLNGIEVSSGVAEFDSDYIKIGSESVAVEEWIKDGDFMVAKIQVPGTKNFVEKKYKVLENGDLEEKQYVGKATYVRVQ